MDHITELRGRIATLHGRRVELGQQSAGYAARSELTVEDRSAWDGLRTQITELDADVARLNNAIEQEEEGLRMSGSEAEREARAARANGSGGSNPPATQTQRSATGTALLEYRSFGPQPTDERTRPMVDMQAWVDQNFRSWMNELRSPEVRGSNYSIRPESRAFQADSDTEGGYLIRPEQFVARLIQAVDNQVFIRQMATVYQVADATALGAPSLDTDVADTDWTVELGTGSEETSLRLGKRSLTPHPLAKRIKISKTLLRLAALAADAIVIQRLAYKFGITQEKAFLTGSGAQQPLGVFTASADGISTGRDVSTGNATTSPTFDGLIEAKYTLKPQYWGKATWMYHRDCVKLLSKLKDGEGDYLWQPSVQAGQPDRILNLPMIMSEYVPNTFTTGLYVGILGDFSNYWIADSLAMEMQRLVELYAETNQVGFIGRLETDGMPVLEEAFVRVKLG